MMHRSSRGAASRCLSQYQRQCRAVAAPIARHAHTGAVLTFLSPSPAHSRAAVAFLDALFRLPRIETTGAGRDGLDALHFGSSSASWDSTACACPTSGTILHFLSCSTEEEEREGEGGTSPRPALHLIAVHGSHSSAPSTPASNFSRAAALEALVECRERLAENIPVRQIFTKSNGALALSALESRLRGLFLNIMGKVRGRYPNPSWILRKLPSTTFPTPLLVDLTPFSSSQQDSSPTDNHGENAPPKDDESLCKGEGKCCKIRELALPFFTGGPSLQATLSKSSLARPLPGLYQCSVGPGGSKDKTKRNPGLIFRPLPAAEEDFHLSPPSLVFQCKSLLDSQKLVEETLGGRTDRIGWRGHSQTGSLIVSHPSTLGLDIRICEGVGAGQDWALSSSFDESTESLLAASLSELQSTHVVSEGKHEDAAAVREDGKILQGDCWVEFRETLKNPAVLFKQLSSAFQKPART